MIGETVSHYRVEARLGSGGMAEVYRAVDTRLDRPVALKFLPAGRKGSDPARQRFMQEARSASALDHPHICTIYDIGESADGRLFIAMAFYPGETLEARIDRGALVVRDACEVALQVASGLAEAHRHGIIHRDIKPANIMLADSGAKILDFGIAKLAGSARITREGMAVGTVAYMAPEQLQGREADARGDVWALGNLLYEMLTGRTPFTGPSEAAIMRAILSRAPEPSGASPLLQSVLDRALTKDPEGRHPTMDAFAADLRKVLGRTTTLYSVPTVSPAPSIAVLPFKDLSTEQDQEFFCWGMAEEILHLLSRVPGLRVVSRTSSFQVSPQEASSSEVGQRLNVGWLLEGSVRKAGARIRVMVRLVEVAQGHQRWSERYDQEIEDVLAIQDEIASHIVEALELTLRKATTEAQVVTGTAALPAVPERIEDLEAYNAYLKGRYYWNRRTEEGLRQGVEHFRQALERMPSYARAHAGLADSWTLLGVYGAVAPEEAMPKAREAALQALELDPRLAEVHTSLGCVEAVYDRDFERSEGSFRHALSLDPGYAPAYHGYAMYCLLPRMAFQSAQRQLRRARELDPLSQAIAASSGLLHHFAGRPDRAVEAYHQTLELESHFGLAHYFLGQALVAAGQLEEALVELKRAVELTAASSEALSALAYAHAVAGSGDSPESQERAQELLTQLLKRAEESYVSPVLLAQIHVGLGQPELALGYLRQAVRIRAADVVWLNVRPAFGPLRKLPEFRALVRDAGLETYSEDAVTTLVD